MFLPKFVCQFQVLERKTKARKLIIFKAKLCKGENIEKLSAAAGRTKLKTVSNGPIENRTHFLFPQRSIHHLMDAINYLPGHLIICLMASFVIALQGLDAPTNSFTNDSVERRLFFVTGKIIKNEIVRQANKSSKRNCKQIMPIIRFSYEILSLATSLKE